jgi:hypothetical protein
MITAQPQSQLVLEGETTNLTVGVSACPPLAYQWYFNGTNGVAGGTAAKLVLSHVSPADSGEYALVVSNSYGSVTSAPALITVVLPPSILNGPADQSTTNGDTVSFTVTAQGTAPLSYQWYFGATNILADETNSTLIISNVTILQAGTYQVVVSNAYGTLTSAPAQLTVISPPDIITGPTDKVATNGNTVQFTVTVEGTAPLAYQWLLNGTVILPQGTTATLTLTGVTPAQAGSYAVVITNAYGSVTSAPAQLNVVVPASIISGPASLAATNGDTVFFTVTAQGSDPLSYAWYFNQTNLIPGAIGPTLMLDNVTSAQAGSYMVVVANAYGSASATALLTVNVPAMIITPPTNQVVTNGATVLFAVVAAGTAPLSYQWFFNATNQISGAAQSTLTLAAVTADNSGAYSVIVSNAFGSVASPAASLRVLVAPQLISLTRNQNVVSLTFSTVNNLLYSVYYLDDISTNNWTLLPKAANLPGTGAPITIQDARANGAQRFYRLVVQ